MRVMGGDGAPTFAFRHMLRVNSSQWFLPVANRREGGGSHQGSPANFVVRYRRIPARWHKARTPNIFWAGRVQGKDLKVQVCYFFSLCFIATILAGVPSVWHGSDKLGHSEDLSTLVRVPAPGVPSRTRCDGCEQGACHRPVVVATQCVSHSYVFPQKRPQRAQTVGHAYGFQGAVVGIHSPPADGGRARPGGGVEAIIPPYYGQFRSGSARVVVKAVC